MGPDKTLGTDQAKADRVSAKSPLAEEQVTVANHRPVRTDNRTGLPLRQAHQVPQMRHRGGLAAGLPFFDSSSRSTAASSICSAKSFFSLAFSSSRAFSRWPRRRPCHHNWLPLVKCRLRDPVLSRRIGRLGPGLVLLQHYDSLLFCKTCLLHKPSAASTKCDSSLVD